MKYECLVKCGFPGPRTTCSPQKHGFSSLWTVQVTPISRAKANCWERRDGEERPGWWVESPGHPFLPPSLIPWLPHLTNPYLPGPTKGGPPTMGETTVAAAAARASRVCWTCWGGGWGKGPDSVLPNCPQWLTLGGQGFHSLHCAWGWLSVNL